MVTASEKLKLVGKTGIESDPVTFGIHAVLIHNKLDKTNGTAMNKLQKIFEK